MNFLVLPPPSVLPSSALSPKEGNGRSPLQPAVFLASTTERGRLAWTVARRPDEAG